MKNLRGLVIAFGIAVLAVGGAVWIRNIRHEGEKQGAAEKAIYYCPMHPNYTSDRPGTCPICNMTLVKKETSDEMHQGHETSETTAREFTAEELVQMKPGEICLLHKCRMGKCLIAMTEEFARLGKCPHCGEDLGVTVKSTLPEGYAHVTLGPEKQKILGVETVPVKRIQLTKQIRTVGRIAFDPELYQAQQEFLQALEAAKKAALSTESEIEERAKRLVESAKIKLRLLGLSDELIGEVETAGAPDRSLLYLDAGNHVWLYAPVYEYELPLVQSGGQVKVDVPSLPGQAFEGVIRSVDPVLDPTTRSARVRAVLENREALLKPEMYVNASIRIDAGEKLAIPKEAVFATGEKNIVFVTTPQGGFEPREVEIGMTTDDQAEIRSGLSEGESVVTSGNFLIDSESRLKAALQGLGSKSGGHQHG